MSPHLEEVSQKRQPEVLPVALARVEETPQTERRVTFDLTDLTVREEPLPGEDPRKLRDARKE